MSVKTKPNNRALKLITTELAAQMHTTGKQIEQLAKRSMRDGGNPHVPSSPGEPPRIDTKNLHESIMTETEVERTSIETRIGTNVRYGLFLELGTRHMAPRPWLRPAFNKVVKS